jgi:DNA-binding transcriptional LysR family regulator
MKYFEPSISSLRLVAMVMRLGKLTSAADELHMSQSAASHALKSLESQLGSQLFRRERDGLRLTEAGQRLRPQIEAALSSIDMIRAEAAGLQTLETGNLRIAAVSSLLGTILPSILREYANRYPGVELAIFEGTDDEVHGWIRSGVAHIGFAALPVDGVESEEIARDEWLALVPGKAYPGKTSMTLLELARQKFLMSGGGCELDILRMFASAGVALTQPMMVKQMPTILAMVAEELGVSLIPRLSLASGWACRALPLKPRQFRHIGMIRSTGYAPTHAAEAWLSLVRARMKRANTLLSTASSSSKTLISGQEFGLDRPIKTVSARETG